VLKTTLLFATGGILAKTETFAQKFTR